MRQLTRALTSVRTAVAVLNGVMMTAVGVLAVIAWQRGSLSTGGVATALGLVLRLNQMSGWMMFNINGLVRNYGTIQDAVATVTVLPTLLDRPDATDLAVPRGEIRFDNVVFHYGKGSGVIDGLSLTIRPGEKVGLVGRSGAGKTTLVNLLLRLYDLEGGRMLIDGVDIADVTQASLRAEIGVVTQDTSLLHRSIRDNIAFGRPDAGGGGGDPRRRARQCGRLHPRPARSCRAQRLRRPCRRARHQGCPADRGSESPSPASC